MTTKIAKDQHVIKKVKFVRSAIKPGDNTIAGSMRVGHGFLDKACTEGLIDVLLSVKNETSGKMILDLWMVIPVRLSEKTPNAAKKLIAKYAEEIGYTEAYEVVKSLCPDLKILGSYNTAKKKMKRESLRNNKRPH